MNTAAVLKLCIGLCILQLGRAAFSPACPASGGSACEDKPLGKISCANQKEWGKCHARWMIKGDYCARTCGRCEDEGSSGCSCHDVQPSPKHSCEKQKRYGKCNASWMVNGGFCNCTCDRCPKKGKGMQTRSLSEVAKAVDKQLREKVFPFWEKTVDEKNGGFFVSYAIDGPNDSKTIKQITAQARNVWGFSHAHINGYSTKDRDYLALAKAGYEFIVEKFLDPVHGGYYWRTDLKGEVVSDVKNMFGQAFVMFGFVEYYRASKDANALQRAVDLFRKIQHKAHDDANGGWVEDFHRDWSRFPSGKIGGGPLGTVGLKANAHLHLIEAFTELYIEVKDKSTKAALVELMDVHRKYFFPKNPADAELQFTYDWKDNTPGRSDSFGRNVQFAWTYLKAEEALGKEGDWKTFDAYIDHALENGYDSAGIGGLREKTNKPWWANAELLAALVKSLSRKSKFDSREEHKAKLLHLLNFLDCYMVDSRDGMWVWETKNDGSLGWAVKANEWKAMYHDIRARVMFVKAFKD